MTQASERSWILHLLSHHTAHPLANPLAAASKHIQILPGGTISIAATLTQAARISCPVGLSASIKTKFRSCHFSSHKSPVASQISVSTLTMPLVAQHPLPPPLPAHLQPQWAPCHSYNTPGRCCLCTCDSLCLEFSCPDAHMVHSLTSSLGSHLVVKTSYHPNENSTHIHSTHPSPSPCVIFLRCTSSQRTSYVFLCVCLSLL